jgi:hypothetical protein
MLPDTKNLNFVIKDTFTGQELCVVPNEITTFNNNDESIKRAVNRMKWIDKNILLITNKDGIEKLIDMDNNFAEISYNVRPLF